MDERRIVSEFIKLVKISGASKNERQVADYVTEMLKRLGFEVSEDDSGKKVGANSGNIIGFKPANYRTDLSVLFSAHMDTVNPCKNVIPIEKDGKLYSDGSTVLGADDRAGINAILTGLKRLSEKRIKHPNIEVVFTICEEMGLLGSRLLDISRLKSKNAFVFDCSLPPGNIVSQTPTVFEFEIVCKGRAAHAAISPEKGVHSIKIAAGAISQIETGRLKENTVFNIGVINGGSATNIVPEKTKIKGEIRCFRDDLLNKILTDTQKVFEKEAKKYGGSIEFKKEKKYLGFNLKEDDPTIKIVKSAMNNLNKRCILNKYTGGSDANNFSEKGIDAVNIGLGTENVHSKDEAISIDNIIFSSNLFIEIINESVKGDL